MFEFIFQLPRTSQSLIYATARARRFNPFSRLVWERDSFVFSEWGPTTKFWEYVGMIDAIYTCFSFVMCCLVWKPEPLKMKIEPFLGRGNFVRSRRPS